MTKVDIDRVVDDLIAELEQEVAGILRTLEERIKSKLAEVSSEGKDMDVVLVLTEEIRIARALIARLRSEASGEKITSPVEQMISELLNMDIGEITDEQLSELLTEFKKTRRHTQREIAEVMGYPKAQGRISHLAAGKRQFSLEEKQKLLAWLRDLYEG
ncbi:hypothetical protein HOG48_04880 [Candidatus Peregrinibacteria bacterium]|jgi:predicted XRE-type DNA-binding protein|nr:hypothetical protein [Candidatus Peregrinibacteria bacterium]